MAKNDIAWFNGQFVPHDSIKISPDDRGFVFADGVYEVIRSYRGQLFCFSDHIERLKRSLKQLWFNFPQIDSIETISKQLLVENNLQNTDAKIYIQITRGVQDRNHKFPENMVEPTVYLTASEFSPDLQEQETGIKAITVSDFRWSRCDIKSISLLANIMARQQATLQQADEAIFIRDGMVLEGTHSNFFGIKNGVLVTHPECNLILSGVTRKLVLQLAGEAGVKIELRPITEIELLELDEIFIACTSQDITPVIMLNHHAIGNRKAGKTTRELQTCFRNYIKLFIENTHS
ncbi:MAG: D-amino-acid transaminase [Bacteroidota bacterium]